MNFFTGNYKGIIQQIEKKYIKSDVHTIHIGDTIKIGILIQEGSKERIQYAEGVIISKHNNNLNTTINIRKVLQGVGVERIVYSPTRKLKPWEKMGA